MLAQGSDLIAQPNKISASHTFRLWTTVPIAGRAVSSLGDYVYLIAINVLVLERTRSALAVATVWVIPLHYYSPACPKMPYGWMPPPLGYQRQALGGFDDLTPEDKVDYVWIGLRPQTTGCLFLNGIKPLFGSKRTTSTRTRTSHAIGLRFAIESPATCIIGGAPWKLIFLPSSPI